MKPQLELRVNDVAIQSVRFRLSFDEPDDFDILTIDPQVRSLVLASDCDLEAREEDSDRRRVTFDQLKSLVVGDSEFLRASDFPRASEVAELQLFDRLDRC